MRPTDILDLAELSTPITFERYTYSKNGSFMGWAIDDKIYGKFMKQKTDVPNLYLVDQWVFPGFGVAGVMASGYLVGSSTFYTLLCENKKIRLC